MLPFVSRAASAGILSRVLGAEHRESGLAARLLLACPTRKPKRWTEDDINPEIQEQVADVTDRLFELRPEMDANGEPHPLAIGMTPEAKVIWVEYYNAHAEEQAELYGDLAAAWSKLEEAAARLALVIHLTRWADGEGDPDTVDEWSMSAGITLARWFAGQAKRTYALMAESEEARNLRELLDWVNEHGGSVTPRDVSRGLSRYRNAVDCAETDLDKLARAGEGVWVGRPTGRPRQANAPVCHQAKARYPRRRRLLLLSRISASRCDEIAKNAPKTGNYVAVATTGLGCSQFLLEHIANFANDSHLDIMQISSVGNRELLGPLFPEGLTLIFKGLNMDTVSRFKIDLVVAAHMLLMLRSVYVGSKVLELGVLYQSIERVGNLGGVSDATQFVAYIPGILLSVGNCPNTRWQIKTDVHNLRQDIRAGVQTLSSGDHVAFGSEAGCREFLSYLQRRETFGEATKSSPRFGGNRVLRQSRLDNALRFIRMVARGGESPGKRIQRGLQEFTLSVAMPLLDKLAEFAGVAFLHVVLLPMIGNPRAPSLALLPRNVRITPTLTPVSFSEKQQSTI